MEALNWILKDATERRFKVGVKGGEGMEVSHLPLIDNLLNFMMLYNINENYLG